MKYAKLLKFIVSFSSKNCQIASQKKHSTRGVRMLHAEKLRVRKELRNHPTQLSPETQRGRGCPKLPSLLV